MSSQNIQSGNYKSLYHKYRVLSLNDIVGQDHITTTLKKAAKNNKFVHSYIFSGLRGTGKTSTARILAAMLNCENLKDSEPCGECESCKSIRSYTSPDIIELDAARNGKVENIHSLIDGTRWPPQKLKKKVFIIDECHCLTNGATSALLKITEEPPPYVVFIFCTTEYDKVISTILSRCQRFNFKNLTSKDIVKRLTFISEKEAFNIEDDAIWELSKIGKGSMRDAITALEQIATIADGKRIGKKAIEKYFGLTDHDIVINIVESIMNGNIPLLLDLINDLVLISADPKKILVDVSETIRNVMILKLTDNSNRLLDIPDIEINRLKDIGKDIPVSKLTSLIKCFSDVDKKMAYNINERWILESSLVSCIYFIKK